MLSASDADGDFMVDFAKTFRTMSQDRRAAWLREAALAASAAEPDEAAAQQAADAAQAEVVRRWTAARIAADVAASVAYSAAREAVPPAPRRQRGRGHPTGDTRRGGRPLGLVAGGAVAFAIRRRRRVEPKARHAPTDVQVRRERQATQAVVTTCAYMLAAVDAA